MRSISSPDSHQTGQAGCWYFWVSLTSGPFKAILCSNASFRRSPMSPLTWRVFEVGNHYRSDLKGPGDQVNEKSKLRSLFPGSSSRHLWPPFFPFHFFVTSNLGESKRSRLEEAGWNLPVSAGSWRTAPPEYILKKQWFDPSTSCRFLRIKKKIRENDCLCHSSLVRGKFQIDPVGPSLKSTKQQILPSQLRWESEGKSQFSVSQKNL